MIREAVIVERLAVPGTVDEAGQVGDAFRAAADFSARVRAAQWGTDAVASSPAEQLARLRDGRDARIIALVANRAGRLVARAVLWLPLLEETTLIHTALLLDPDLADAERTAVLAALLDEVEAISDAESRGWLLAYAPVRAGALTPESGVGGADPAAPEASVLLARGFALQQVERHQLADLTAVRPPVDPPGDGYRVLAVTGRTPEELRPALRALRPLMQTEAPTGGVPFEPQVWDEERLSEYERSSEEGGGTLVTAVALGPEGDPAGFSELVVGQGVVVRQGDTLVVPGHRGRGLGLRLKSATLARVRGSFPEHRWVVTTNAEENTHMLAINERLGFVTAHREGMFQRLPS